MAWQVNVTLEPFFLIVLWGPCVIRVASEGNDGKGGSLWCPPETLTIPPGGANHMGRGGHLTFDLQVRHDGYIVLVIGSLAEIVSCVVGLEVSNAQGPVGVGEEALVL